VIDQLYPEQAGYEPEPAASPPPPPHDAVAVRAVSSGYVQSIDLDALVVLAEQRECIMWLRVGPGDFVIAGSDLAVISPPPADAATLASTVRDACVLHSDRTAWQDAEFAVQQLVEVTLHALSPALNEPFTAISCIDRLGQGLSLMATRRMPSAARTDRAGRIRLVAEPQSFPRLNGLRRFISVCSRRWREWHSERSASRIARRSARRLEPFAMRLIATSWTTVSWC
jgi:uncharacterized membrane protein